jgi:hypothetical protein
MPQHNALGLSPALDALIDGCLAGLEANLSADPPALWDPHSKQDTPPSHYAYCSLALALHQRKPGSPKWQTALDAYLAIPKQKLGHHPFNRLLLLLLRDALDKDNPLAVERVSTALQRCPLDRHYPSNNWTLLAQLCRILEGRTNPRAHQRAVADFERLLTRWMTPAGGFIDYPAKPKEGKGSTPIAYHHKALFLTAVAVLYGGAHALAPRLQALLDWAIQWIDQGGLCGGFGRTNHGLFGDACLLSSLTLLQRSGACSDPNLISTLARIARRLHRQQREDGLIWLTPTGTEGWDDYMHLSVYDAWFVATLAWAGAIHLQKFAQTINWAEPTEGLFMDEVAGLLAWRARSKHGMLEAMISTTGQPAQGLSRSQIDLRYSGGIPFNLTLSGASVASPPIRVPNKQLRQAPHSTGGYSLIFEYEHAIYGLGSLRVITLESLDRELNLTLHARLLPLTSQSMRIGVLARFVSALDWRLLGSRLTKHRILHPKSLLGFDCELTLSISATTLLMTQRWAISSKCLKPLLLLNPPTPDQINTKAASERTDTSTNDSSTQVAIKPVYLTPGRHTFSSVCTLMPKTLEKRLSQKTNSET